MVAGGVGAPEPVIGGTSCRACPRRREAGLATGIELILTARPGPRQAACALVGFRREPTAETPRARRRGPGLREEPRDRAHSECRGRGLAVPEAVYPGLGAFSGDGPAPGRNPNGWPISSSRAWITASPWPTTWSRPR